MNRRHVFLLSAIVVIGLVVAACYQPTQFIAKYKVIDLIARDSLQTFLGLPATNKQIKIAFTKKEDRRVVFFADYSQAVPHATRLITPAGNADSPLIDPTGTWVTYYIAEESGVYIQKLDSTANPILIAQKGTEPHWWKDSNGTYLVYSTKFLVDVTALATIGTDTTYMQQIDLPNGGIKIGNAVAIADKPFNGGLSTDGAYLCTGNSAGAFYKRNDPSPFIPINSGLQICNPSISPDPLHPDWMMFLNFSGVQNMNTSIVGVDFGSTNPHDHIFIVDALNRVQNYIAIPADYPQWQDPEWSNKPNFATALGRINEAEYDGVIINLSTKNHIVFTTGANILDNTSTPSLWIGN